MFFDGNKIKEKFLLKQSLEPKIIKSGLIGKIAN